MQSKISSIMDNIYELIYLITRVLYLHILSKQLLYEYLCSCKENKTPFLIKYNRRNCLYIDNAICNSFKSQETYNLFDYFQNIYLEKSTGDYIPDILLESNNKKNQLFIEIVVSHKSTEKKKEENKIVEIFIDSEYDIFDIIKEGINENNERIKFINFNRSIIHSEYCNENDCKNDVDYLLITKKTKPKKVKIIVFKDLLKNKNIKIHKISGEENRNHDVQKYLNLYSKEKNNIKNIHLYKYNTQDDFYNRFLIIEMKQ